MNKVLDYEFLDTTDVTLFYYDTEGKIMKIGCPNYWDRKKNKKINELCILSIESWSRGKSIGDPREPEEDLDYYLGIPWNIFSLTLKGNILEILMRTTENAIATISVWDAEISFSFEKPHWG